jgi:hypothetical protein
VSFDARFFKNRIMSNGNDSDTSTTTSSSSSNHAAEIRTCRRLQNFVWVRQGKTEHAAEYADGMYQVTNKFDITTDQVVEHVWIQWQGTSRRDFVPVRDCRPMYNDGNDQEIARSPPRTRKAPNRLGAWDATGRPAAKKSLASNSGPGEAQGGVLKKSRGASVIVHPPPQPRAPPPPPPAPQTASAAAAAAHPGIDSDDSSSVAANCTANVAATTTTFGTEMTTPPLLPLSRRCRSRAIAKKSLARSLLTTDPRQMRRLVTTETTMPQAACLVIDLTTPSTSPSDSCDSDDNNDNGKQESNGHSDRKPNGQRETMSEQTRLAADSPASPHGGDDDKDSDAKPSSSRVNGPFGCRKSVSWKLSLKAPPPTHTMEKKSLKLASSSSASASVACTVAAQNSQRDDQRKPAAKETRRNRLIESSDPFQNQWASSSTTTANDHVVQKCPCHGRDLHQRSAGIGGESRFYGRRYRKYPPSFQLVPRHWNDGGPYFSNYVTEAQFHALYNAHDNTIALDFCDQGSSDDDDDE